MSNHNKWFLFAVAVLVSIIGVPEPLNAQVPISGQAVPSLSQLDTVMTGLLSKWQAPGGALAVARNGRLVFARGYGYADKEAQQPVQPDSLFRIASNSKPITAAAILKLIEQGKLTLTTKAFSVLSDLTPPPGTTVDPRLNDITIQHLLEHKAGWDIAVMGLDPVFNYQVTAANTFGVAPPGTPATLIRYMMGRPLQHTPGTTYSYSNLGYLVLGQIIEKASGQGQATYINDNIFAPAGIRRMQPARTLLSNRYPDEVKYYDYPGAPLRPSVLPPVNALVPAPYGVLSFENALAFGGWLATPMDLLRFADNINGQLNPPILAAPPAGFVQYVPPKGPGWAWRFFGSLTGTTSVSYMSSGFQIAGGASFAVIFNSRPGGDYELFNQDAQDQILTVLQGVQAWPVNDLYPIYGSTISACSFAAPSLNVSISSSGGASEFPVNATNNCSWTATSDATWLTAQTAYGSGQGMALFNAQPNTLASARTANVSVADKKFTITQAGAIPGLNFVGSLAHLASGGTWQTFFQLVNPGGAAARARLNLYADSGNALALPFTDANPPAASSLDRSVPSNGSILLDSNGPDSQPVNVGSAHLFADGALRGFAVFRWKFLQQEAVVPLETRDATAYFLPFDNTNGVDLGVAISNVASAPANIGVTLTDDQGAQIGSDSLSLPALGHASWVLKDRFPVTANRRGLMVIRPPGGGRISALGIRFTPPGTLTTIPVLANVGSGGGTFAHLASGGGWKTSIVLVNAGGSPANASLRFLDDAGTQLTLPLTFPQEGTATSASSLDRTLPAMGSLVVESEGSLTTPLSVGSVQLTTGGNISGFVVFRYQPNGQEAVVPLEARNSGSYVVAFDNTAGLATGTAVSNSAEAAAAIPVVIRDESGVQIGTATLTLAANGHTSFVLATQYPATAGRRGTIEFTTPPGGKISAIGIRTTVPQLTFTSLPTIVR